MRIPAAPGALRLPVDRTWAGGPADPALAGSVALAAHAQGIQLHARFPLRAGARLPDAAPGSRVADLWTYDVAECFIVGRDGRYVEVELGAGGHFLVLSFDAPRCQRDAHSSFAPRVEWRRTSRHWSSRLTLPWSLVPREPSRVNAFAIFGEHFLLHAALPGDAPDFHQPAHYPAVALSREAAAAATRSRAS